MKSKINMQQVSRTKTQNKNKSTNKNQQATRSFSKIIFTREKSTYRFHEEKNQYVTRLMNKNQQITISSRKISSQQVPWNK